MTGIKYEFADQPLIFRNSKKADAQKIGTVLDELLRAKGGRLKPADIVAAAKSKRSPLHRHVTWDDTVAGDRWRLQEARCLLQTIRSRDLHEDRPDMQRAFVSLTDREGKAYRGRTEIEGSVPLQVAAMEMVEAELAGMRRRFRDITEICGPLKEAEDKLSATRKSWDPEGPPLS